MSDKFLADLALTDCNFYDNDTCVHRNCLRRLPVLENGLGLCPNLSDRGKQLKKIIVSYKLDDTDVVLEKSVLVDDEKQIAELLTKYHKGKSIQILKMLEV